MRRFNYKARDKETGKFVKGSIQADSERTAGRLLIEQGLYPSSVIEEGGNSVFTKLANRVSQKDKIVFTRQFATLIGAGLPLSNSLRTVAEQTESKAMRSVIEEILASVESGRSLSDACAAHPEVFDKVYLALIGAGEMSGTLDESLRRLAMQQEKDAQMLSKIKGALTYPLIVLVVITGVVLFMVIAVVPQVENLYKDLKKPLPTSTAFMVAIANFLMNYWYVVIAVLVIAGVLFASFKKTKTGIKTIATFKLRVPMFNQLFRRLYMARFARTAQILLSTGVPMLDMMKIASEAMNNVVVQEQFDQAAEMIKGGKPLSESLRDREFILPLLPQMASIGEQSGKIDDMLGKVAQVYEDELDEQIRTISTMIEPVLMVVLAVVAGGMVGAILMPIYGLVNDLT